MNTIANKQSTLTLSVPATESQKEIWASVQMGKEASCAYNLSFSLEIKGNLDLEVFKKSIQMVIQRHESLRITFSSDGSNIFITPSLTIDIPVIDLSNLAEDEKINRVATVKKQVVKEPFNLEKSPLFRGQILKLEPEEYMVIFTTHHIVCDGWSRKILTTELGQIYSALIQGIEPQLKPADSFTEYAILEEQRKSQKEGKETEEFWLKQFSDLIPIVDFPTDRPRPPLRTFNSLREDWILPETLVTKLKALGHKQGCSLMVIMLAGFEVFIHRITGQKEIAIGIPSAGQLSSGKYNLMGNCVNLLPIRANITGEQTFSDYLKMRKGSILDAFDHSELTFGSLVQKLAIKRDPSRIPLVPIMFSMFMDLDDLDFAGFEVKNHLNPRYFENFELSIDSRLVKGKIILECQYNTNLFDAQTIRYRLAEFETLLTSIGENEELIIAKLPLLPESEKQLLLNKWNQTEAEYPALCIHQLFEAQVTKTPEKIAVIFEDQKLTYQELNEKANQLAQYLQTLVVKPDDKVGICIERSLEMLIGLLGILKAGGCYIPLDPTFPQERLAWMIEDSQLSVLVTQAKLGSILPAYEHQVELVLIDTDWQKITEIASTNPLINNSLKPENLAYIIYTSGSTGKPKGVQLQHNSVVNFLTTMAKEPGLNENDILVALTTISFDIAVLELYLPLSLGACVVIANDEVKRDGLQLGKLLNIVGGNVVQATPATWKMLSETGWQGNSNLKILCGGESVSPNLISQLLDKSLCIWNVYGPTETTVWSTTGKIESANYPISIGKPIANTQIYILDQNLQPTPIGVSGELYIGGDGLARGYLNRPDLTAEKFIPNPFNNDPQSRIYNTGDLARWLSNGQIECLGRTDYQVKVRGFRIELGEIENILHKHPSVQEPVVVAREDGQGDEKILVAYLVMKEGEKLNISEIRHYLKDKLPDYMIPSLFMRVEKMPQTPNGKIDRKALPIPEKDRSALDNVYVPPQSELENNLVKIWCDLLRLDQVGIEDNFFDLGGHSLLVVQMMSVLKEQLKLELSITQLFQYPTIRDLAKNITQKTDQASQTNQNIQNRIKNKRKLGDDIAIIGMAGRFPGANNVEKLWENLCNNVESTTFFKDEDLDPSIDPELLHNPNYIKAKGFVENSENFDAAFFGINPLEAKMMDPQHRIFLEVAYEALEDAGYSSDQYQGAIGVFAGAEFNYYLLHNIAGRKELIDNFGEFQIMVTEDKDFIPTRVSYKLNLKGPSVSINTACSTGLVTVISAVNSLRNNECDIALAGGVTIIAPIKSGYLHQEGNIFSSDGHVRPFDADATGTIFNDGVAIVVLKRLEDALKDGDRIDAVIKGVGINNDGSDKMSFTAPSINGQSEAIMIAHADAQINPETITYIETHGTATPVGDPIEVVALTQAFNHQTKKTGFCAIGSIKSNVGHLVAAAGTAGLIKTALSLKYQKIPATLHYEKPNPRIDFAKTPFYVNAKLTEWENQNDHPRRAGVSSFGIGGTNAHVVLEEPPEILPSSSSRSQQLLLISAKTASALDQSTKNLAQYLRDHPEISLADGAYTLQVGRNMLPHRRFIVCQNTEEAIANLTHLPPHKTATRNFTKKTRELVFMFPGQGSQYVNMGLNLYQTEPLFKEIIDYCSEQLKPYIGDDLRHFLYPAPEDTEKATLSLKETRITQPAIFTLEYALAQLWMSWGIFPTTAIGHSVGEFVVACLAGVFSLEDALKLVGMRGKLMQNLPKGSMLSVRSQASEVEKWLKSDLIPEQNQHCSVATINSPTLCVVSGPTDIILEFQKIVEKKEIVCKFLHTSHAFHSPMMNPAIEPFSKIVQTIPLSPPKFPFVSTVTGEWLTDPQATDPQYWTDHLRETVRFADAVKTLWEKPDRILLEVGPRNTIATLARQQIQSPKEQVAISSLNSTSENDGEWIALLEAIGQLYLVGIPLNWQKFYQSEKRHRVPLPTYPFEGKRFWIDPIMPLPKNGKPLSVNGHQPPVNNIDQSAFILVSPSSNSSPPTTESRQQRLIPILKELLENSSGFEFTDIDNQTTFLEIGLDSLSLTQVALNLKNKFKVNITFRKLMETYPNLETLSKFLDQELPPDAFAPSTPQVSQSGTNTPNSHNTHNAPAIPSPISQPLAFSLENITENLVIVAQQLQIMAQKLELLTGQSAMMLGAVPSNPSNVSQSSVHTASVDSVNHSAPKTPESAVKVETKAKTDIKNPAIPHPQARLGKDREGNPAWFIPDPHRQGKYLQIQK